VNAKVLGNLLEKVIWSR